MQIGAGPIYGPEPERLLIWIYCNSSRPDCFSA